VNGSLAETSTLFTKAEDKNNSRLNRRLMGRFKAALDELELMELPLHGRKFTWTSSHSSQSEVTMTRIDKMSAWEEMFPTAHLQAWGPLPAYPTWENKEPQV
jgi:hypothetical protein